MKKDRKFLRQCAACKEYKSKEDLIRLTKDYKSGIVSINNNNSVQGRSLYVCKNEKCLGILIKKKITERTLKAEIPLNIKENLDTVLPN